MNFLKKLLDRFCDFINKIFEKTDSTLSGEEDSKFPQVHSAKTPATESQSNSDLTSKGGEGSKSPQVHSAKTPATGNQLNSDSTSKEEQNLESSFMKSREIDVRRPYTIQVEPFLKSHWNLPDERYIVKYSIQDSKSIEFPLIRAPKKGCEIKLPVTGRSGRRGVCEETFCRQIEALSLYGFYDDLSLFVRGYAFEPDLAYIDKEKGIFIDIEIDEPYSGWERKPIHYKINNGTIDDLRNSHFTERGWTVIRFSEKQIYNHPKSCLKKIYQLLHSMDVSIDIPQSLVAENDIDFERLWTNIEAKRLERDHEREKLLGVNRFILPSDTPHAIVHDYPYGLKFEENFSKSKREQLYHELEIKTTVTSVPSHETSIVRPSSSLTTNCGKNDHTEIRRNEHPQQISTQSKPKTTPSSRGYA